MLGDGKANEMSLRVSAYENLKTKLTSFVKPESVRGRLRESQLTEILTFSNGNTKIQIL